MKNPVHLIRLSLALFVLAFLVTCTLNPMDPEDTDQFAGNQSKSTAAPVSAGQTYNDLRCKTQDWFKLTVNSTDVTISIKFISLYGNLDLYRYDEFGTPIDTSNSMYLNEESIVVPAGTYYFKVAGYNGESNNYKLEITGTSGIINTSDDIYEPNNSFSAAYEIAAGTLSLRSFDADWYKIYLNAGDTLHDSISFSISSGDLDLYLYNSSNVGVDYSASSYTSYEEVTYVAPSSGYYYIQITGYSGAYTNGTPYVMTSEVGSPTAIADDSYEQNDIQSAAYTVSAGLYSDLKSYDQDWYKVSLNSGDTLYDSISFSNASGNLDLYLYNASATNLQYSTSTINNYEKVTYVAPSTGYYYVAVFGSSSAYVNGTAYSMTVRVGTFASITDDSYEQNDTMTTASTITAGTISSLKCYDQDWYKVYLSAGDTIRDTITFLHSSGDIDAYLYNSSGIYQDYSTGTANFEELYYVATTAGYVYIKIYGPTNGTVYAMKVTVRSPVVTIDDIYENNDSLPQAYSLSSLGNYTSLMCKDEDWYKVYITAGNILTVRTEFTAANGDLELALYDGTRTMLMSSTSSSNNYEQVSFSVFTTGYYYIKVYGYSGAQNSYSMTLSSTTIAINNIPAKVTNFLSQPLIDTLVAHGLVIHSGSTPPTMDGVYCRNNNVLVGSNLSGDYPGDPYGDYSEEVYSQDGDSLLFNYQFVDGTDYASAIRGYISGSGTLFTMFLDIQSTTISDSADQHEITVHSPMIISGEWTASGIKDYQNGFIFTNKSNDYYNELINVGDARVFAEGDSLAYGVSSFPCTSPFPKKLNRNASDEKSRVQH